MIRIFGHSDDCFEIRGDEKEEFGAINKRVEILIGDKTAGVVVGGRFGDTGVWEFDVCQVDEGVPVPWPIAIETEHEYSLAVVVRCPPGTPWTRTA